MHDLILTHTILGTSSGPWTQAGNAQCDKLETHSHTAYTNFRHSQRDCHGKRLCIVTSTIRKVHMLTNCYTIRNRARAERMSARGHAGKIVGANALVPLGALRSRCARTDHLHPTHLCVCKPTYLWGNGDSRSYPHAILLLTTITTHQDNSDSNGNSNSSGNSNGNGNNNSSSINNSSLVVIMTIIFIMT